MPDARAFCLRWQSDFPLHLLAGAQQAGTDFTEPDIVVEQCNWPPPEDAFQTQMPACWLGDERQRLFTENGSVIDVIGADKIQVFLAPDLPLTDPPNIPPEFYSRAIAIICAQRGLLPIHGSSVAIGDKAFLLFGESGNGKSSAAAALIGMGAKLLSDDLSVFFVDNEGVPWALPGRLGIRLSPGTEVLLGKHEGGNQSISESRGKSRFFPPCVECDLPIELAGMVYMDTTGECDEIPRQFAAPILNQHIFARLVLQEMKGSTDRYAKVRKIVDHIGCQRIKGLADRAIEPFQKRLKSRFFRYF